MSTSRLALFATVAASLAGVLVVGAPLLVQLGALPGFVAFRLFGLGFLVGILALLFGLLGVLATRPAKGRAGRRRALGATLTGALIVGVVLSIAAPGMRVPPINDITTDPADPPAFHASEPGAYPAEFAEHQAVAYPDLQTIALSESPTRAHTKVLSAMRDLGWEIVHSDPEAGRIEATETSRVFRFVDDVAVRIRPAAEGGSLVDVRSKSRDGKSDLGANAARIRRLRDAIQ
jgi:uncharacterized protein (DUF1499 family)